MIEQSPRNELEISEGCRKQLAVAAETGALPLVIKVTLPLLRAGEQVQKG